MKDTFKKTIIWTNAEPPRNYLWGKGDKIYEYSGNWIESKLFNRDFIPVNKIGLNKSKLNLRIGKTANLVASVEPEDSTERSVTWITSNPEVVKVSNSGRVTGVSEGIATVFTAIGGKFASCEIVVS